MTVRNGSSGKVQHARASGRLPEIRACEVCLREKGPDDGPQAFHWHHWSYRTEHLLDVIPLCAKCHMRVHRGKIPEPRTGRIYRWESPQERALTFGVLLSNEMYIKRMTHDTLADRLSTRPATVDDYLCGRSFPDDEHFQIMAGLFRWNGAVVVRMWRKATSHLTERGIDSDALGRFAPIGGNEDCNGSEDTP